MLPALTIFESQQVKQRSSEEHVLHPELQLVQTVEELKKYP